MPIALLICLLMLEPARQAQPKKLTLNAAIQAALENNPGVRISDESEVQARARVEEQRAVLAPNVNGLVSHADQTINLGARGLNFPGLPFPHRVGPFGDTETRVQFSEPLDLSLIRRYQSSKRTADSAQFETEAIKNKIASTVARLYFGVQSANAFVGAVRAQIELDQSLLKLARDRQEVGTGTGLDVTRAQSRLAANQHRLLQSQNDLRTAELQLLRAMGERLDSRVELTDSMTGTTVPAVPADEAVTAAFRNRPELRSEEKKLEAARLTFGAARAEVLPTVQAFADYGNSGNVSSSFLPTRTIGAQLNVPLFDAGRRAAHRKSAESQLRQAEVRAKDVRDQIELEVRLAVDNLASAREQLKAAEQSLKLAQEELDLSRLRFEAQVTTQIDVLNAQAELATARSRHVNALFTLKSAEIDYQRAAGLEIK